MTIRTARIDDEPAPRHGVRALVDRLWPRGLSKDDAAVDLWAGDAAPSNDLRKWCGHDPERWPEFRRRCLHELAQRRDAVEPLLDPLRKGRTLTLLSATKEHRRRHSRTLAEYLRLRMR